MHNKLIILFDQHPIAEREFFVDMQTDSLCFREEFALFLNSFGASIRGQGEIDSAKSAFLLSLEIFETEQSLMALVLLFFENKHRKKAQQFALKYLELGEKRTSPLDGPKSCGHLTKASNPSFKEQSSATMKFMKTVAKG